MRQCKKRSPLPLYTPTQFEQRVSTDLWVLKEVLRLPEDPVIFKSPTYDEQTGITMNYMISVDDICLPARQQSVRAYRDSLSPIIFTLAEKVYAELFQVFLGQNNRSRQETQNDVEREIDGLTTTQLIQQATFSPVFLDRTDFDDWWQGTYQYKELRQARNRIEHDEYQSGNNTLDVTNRSGSVVLHWNADTILQFAEKVLGKARLICPTLKI